MPDLDGAVTWLNSTPLSSKSLRGKVVLVNFGRTRVSTACASFLTSRRGRRSIRMPAWLSSAFMRLSSASRKIRRT
jgi:hypothetical protein